MPPPPHPTNDNTPPDRMVPIIGVIGDGGRVRFTDPTWRNPATRPRPRPRLRTIDP